MLRSRRRVVDDDEEEFGVTENPKAKRSKAEKKEKKPSPKASVAAASKDISDDVCMLLFLTEYSLS